MFSRTLARVAMALPLLVGVSAATFALLHLIPGDPAVAMLGSDGATPEAIAAVREKYLLDKPLPLQFAAYLARTATGDLGTSTRTGLPVTTMLLQGLNVTTQLVGAGMLVAVMTGVLAGTIAGGRVGGMIDRIVTISATIAHSLPNFWVGLLMIIVFGLTLGWLPVFGFESVFESPIDGVRSLILPALTLGLPAATEIARQLRTAIARTLESPHTRAAVASGIAGRSLLLHYVYPSSLPPVITTFGVVLVRMFGATLIVEHIFAVPGLGSALVSAVYYQDRPFVLGAILAFGALVISVNVAVDLLQALINPQLRVARTQ